MPLASFFFVNLRIADDFFKLQEQEKVHNRPKIHEPRKAEQEQADEKDLMDERPVETMLERLGSAKKCFLRNFATSACPNAAKGIFVDLEGAKGFLKGHPEVGTVCVQQKEPEFLR